MEKPPNIDPAELVSNIDIAALCGVNPQAVSNWKARYGRGSDHPFPKSVATVAHGKVDLYLRTEILEWFQVHSQKSGFISQQNKQ